MYYDFIDFKKIYVILLFQCMIWIKQVYVSSYDILTKLIWERLNHFK